jgi:hypothetical protein
MSFPANALLCAVGAFALPEVLVHGARLREHWR